MSSVTSMQDYLNSKGIGFEIITHKHTDSSVNSAASAHIPSAQLAKAVMLHNTLNQQVMAVVPASRKLKVSALNDFTYSDFKLMQEGELIDCFYDCEAGVAPSAGGLYGMNMIVDEELLQESNIYLESGDHRHLLKLSQQDYQDLVMSSRHASIAATASDRYAKVHQVCAVFA